MKYPDPSRRSLLGGLLAGLFGFFRLDRSEDQPKVLGSRDGSVKDPLALIPGCPKYTVNTYDADGSIVAARRLSEVEWKEWLKSSSPGVG